MRKIVVIGGIAAAITLGIVIGKAGGSTTANAAAPASTVVTKTVEAPPAAPVTVTAAPGAPVTVTAPPPAPVTVTAAPAAPQATDDPNGPKDNGKYLIGSQVSGGTWQCDKPGSMPNWEIDKQDGSIQDIQLDSIAIVPGGYTLKLDGCDALWTKVG